MLSERGDLFKDISPLLIFNNIVLKIFRFKNGCLIKDFKPSEVTVCKK